jgi:hypothetical protein
MAAARGFVWTPAPGAATGWTLRGRVLQMLQMQLTVASSDSSPWRLGTDGLGEAAACIAIAGTQGRWQTAGDIVGVKWIGASQTGWVLAIKVAGAGPSVWGASLNCTDYSAVAASV